MSDDDRDANPFHRPGDIASTGTKQYPLLGMLCWKQKKGENTLNRTKILQVIIVNKYKKM